MTDTEIDKRLALAIGYRSEDVLDLGDSGRITVWRADRWHVFSHKEWETIGPIAERFDLFPVRLTDGKWSRVVCGPAPAFLLTDIIESTPQRCIALAALCALERK
jgi:hypothetical protein